MASIDLFQQWRTANNTAMVAAKATLVKSILALDGEGDPPTPDETEAVRSLRSLADDLFELAIARMGEAVAARRLRAKMEPSYVKTWAAPLV